MPGNDDYKIDMRPLDKPVNPFGYAAQMVRARHPKLEGEDAVAVEWLEFLAKASPELTTTHANVVLLLAESANFLETRQALEEGLAIINREIAAATAA